MIGVMHRLTIDVTLSVKWNETRDNESFLMGFV